MVLSINRVEGVICGERLRACGAIQSASVCGGADQSDGADAEGFVKSVRELTKDAVEGWSQEQPNGDATHEECPTSRPDEETCGPVSQSNLTEGIRAGQLRADAAGHAERCSEPKRQVMKDENNADSKNEEQKDQDASMLHELWILQVLQLADEYRNDTWLVDQVVNKRGLWMTRMPPRCGCARGK